MSLEHHSLTALKMTPRPMDSKSEVGAAWVDLHPSTEITTQWIVIKPRSTLWSLKASFTAWRHQFDLRTLTPLLPLTTALLCPTSSVMLTSVTDHTLQSLCVKLLISMSFGVGWFVFFTMFSCGKQSTMKLSIRRGDIVHFHP